MTLHRGSDLCHCFGGLGVDLGSWVCARRMNLDASQLPHQCGCHLGLTSVLHADEQYGWDVFHCHDPPSWGSSFSAPTQHWSVATGVDPLRVAAIWRSYRSSKVVYLISSGWFPAVWWCSHQQRPVAQQVTGPAASTGCRRRRRCRGSPGTARSSCGTIRR